MCRDCLSQCSKVDLATCCERCGHPQAKATDLCSRCEHWTLHVEAARSVFAFNGPARLAVHRLKYRQERARAEWCGELMSSLLTELAWSCDTLVPVPLHAKRFRDRGFNQAEVLCNVISERAGIAVRPAVGRWRATPSQVGLSADQRLANVEGAFIAHERLTNANVLLVDDVLTTGATLNACALACIDAGAKQVRAITFAIGL
jgi:competence protein ComFC